MAVSPIPQSVKLLHTNTNHNVLASRVSFSATSNTTHPAKHFHLNQRLFKNKTASPDFPSLRKTLPNDLAVHRVLIKEYADEKNGTSSEKVQTEEEVIASVVNRLMAVVEKMREREIQKFMSKVKGELSYEDSVILAEEASREIVNKFLEKPIKYLRSNDGHCMEEKLRDLNFLIGIIENSCPANQR